MASLQLQEGWRKLNQLVLSCPFSSSLFLLVSRDLSLTGAVGLAFSVLKE
jgi:hypothetical protein